VVGAAVVVGVVGEGVTGVTDSCCVQATPTSVSAVRERSNRGARVIAAQSAGSQREPGTGQINRGPANGERGGGGYRRC
jgi:hypothetical protein